MTNRKAIDPGSFRRVAYALYALMLFGLILQGSVAYIRVLGGFFALACAALAVLNPKVRIPSIAAALCWCLYPIAVALAPKLFFGEGMIVLTMTSYALLATANTAFAKRVLITLAFFVTYFFASYARQAMYEIGTLGHLTNVFDACGNFFAPLGLVLVAAISLAIAFFFTFQTEHDIVRLITANERTQRFIRSYGLAIALSIAIVAGTAEGIKMWSDWQINYPCL